MNHFHFHFYLVKWWHLYILKELYRQVFNTLFCMIHNLLSKCFLLDLQTEHLQLDVGDLSTWLGYSGLPIVAWACLFSFQKEKKPIHLGHVLSWNGNTSEICEYVRRMTCKHQTLLQKKAKCFTANSIII